METRNKPELKLIQGEARETNYLGEEIGKERRKTRINIRKRGIKTDESIPNISPDHATFENLTNEEIRAITGAHPESYSPFF